MGDKGCPCHEDGQERYQREALLRKKAGKSWHIFYECQKLNTIWETL